MKIKKYLNDIMTDERRIKHKIVHFHHRFDRILHDRLSKTEIFVGESKILMLISENEDISQSEIAKRKGISTASVGVSLKKLESKGYIQRITDVNDSRANKIILTPKGDEFIEAKHETFQALDKQTFKNFSKEELDLLEKLLDKLHDNLSEM